MARPATTIKFYFKHTKQQVCRHKCNSCLGICSIFIVVIISALCYTLVEDTPVVFFRQSEQDYGQYDIKITPYIAPFLNYSLVQNLLQTSSKFSYNSPRISYNETQSIIYPSYCSEIFNENNYNYNDKCIIDIPNNTLCNINHISSASIWFIDFHKESNMEFGRSFDMNNAPNEGEIILTSDIALALDVDIFDTIYIKLPLNSSSVPLLLNYLSTNYIENISFNAPELFELINNDCNSIVIPFNVSYITSDESLGGKFSETSSQFDAVIDINYFMNLYLKYLPQKLINEINKYDSNIENDIDNGIDNGIIYDYITSIYVNLPPNRVMNYLSTDYRDILSILVQFSSEISYKLGWTEINMNLDILESMQLISATVLSLSVVLDMIVFVLIILSCGLLYSLLVISVDSKRFMLGIFRMLGMSKKSLVSLLISQSFGYSIPAYIVGMILAQLGAIVVTSWLGQSGNITLDSTLSTNAIIIATVVGIGCSGIAAILPIRSSLQSSLRDVLDIRHSTTIAVQFNINRSDSSKFSWNLFYVCIVLVLFGWFIFYFLPQSMLSGDLGRVALMLFSLMLAMLCGFVLFGINIQHIIERIFIKLLLFWETRPIPNIVLKNLIAHRIRNRKTAIMYSLSLSFIFMITVMIGSNIEYMKVNSLRNHGTVLYFRHPIHRKDTTYQAIEDLLQGKGNFSDENNPNITGIHNYIEDFAWRPWSVRQHHHGVTTFYDLVSARNIGRVFYKRVLLFPIFPNFENVAGSRFIKPTSLLSSSLSGSEMLFTAAGSQRALMGNSITDKLKLKDLNDPLLIKFKSTSFGFERYIQYKSLGWYNLYPYYSLKERDGYYGNDLLISISSLPRIFNDIESIEDIWLWGLWLKFESNIVLSEVNYVKSVLNNYFKHVWDYNKFSEQVADGASMLDLIFSLNTYMALFLCLFSLIASMSTNIIEQTKEIGIFRSMGLTKFQINKIYIYESLILILSSSFIGIIIGTVLCFVILQQQQLFTQYPVDFYVPISVIYSCITGAIVTSVSSVYFPLKNLNKKQIAESLRQVL